MKTDISIIINFNINDEAKTTIKTNAKPEALEEILSDWIRDQAGLGEDLRNPNVSGVYEIQINLDLSGDIFTTSSDTGNDGLTAGIVQRVFGTLKEIEVLPLS